MITASIVAYHTPVEELSKLLDCVVHSSIDLLYLIDNSSNDSLREFANKSPKIVYIYSDNLGFGHGHNIGIRKAIEKEARYHIVINPDVYWDGSVIEQLAEFMDAHTDCGLVMPKVTCLAGDSSLSATFRRKGMPDLNCMLPVMTGRWKFLPFPAASCSCV